MQSSGRVKAAEHELRDYSEVARAEQRASALAIMAALTDGGEEALSKLPRPRHLTASCFLFDSTLENILLSFHAKGRFWVQFGGHVEQDDDSLRGAALRELREESGVAGGLLLSHRPFDVDLHDLSAAFGPCRTHLDVAYAALVPRKVDIHPSEESIEIGWWPISQPVPGAVYGLWDRVERVVEQVKCVGLEGFAAA